MQRRVKSITIWTIIISLIGIYAIFLPDVGATLNSISANITFTWNRIVEIDTDIDSVGSPDFYYKTVLYQNKKDSTNYDYVRTKTSSVYSGDSDVTSSDFITADATWDLGSTSITIQPNGETDTKEKYKVWISVGIWDSDSPLTDDCCDTSSNSGDGVQDSTGWGTGCYVDILYNVLTNTAKYLSGNTWTNPTVNTNGWMVFKGDGDGSTGNGDFDVETQFKISDTYSDSTAPTTTCVLSKPTGKNGWYIADAKATLTATDNSGGTGIRDITYQVNSVTGVTTTTNPIDVTISSEGKNNKIKYSARDAANQEWFGTTSGIDIDKTIPTKPTVDDGVASWTTSNSLTFTFSASDATSGIDGYNYWVQPKTGNPSKTWTTSGSASLTSLPDGTNTFCVEAMDKAGLVGNTGTHQFFIDTIAPTTPTPLPTTTDWISSSTMTVSWSAASDGSDSSGIKEYQYKIDSGSWTATTQTSVQFTSLSDGTHTFYLKALDNVNNEGLQQSCTFKIDTTPPTTPTPSPTTTDWVSSSSMTVSWTAATDGSDSSGVKEYQYKLDSGSWIATPQTTVQLTSLIDGSHTFYLKVLDNVVNVGTEQTCLFKIDTTAPATTIPSPTATDWVSSSSMTVSWTAATDGSDSSGVKEYQYKLDSGSWIATPQTTVQLTSLIDGSHTFYLKVLDNAVNIGTEQTCSFKIDTTAPTTPTPSPTTTDWVSSSSMTVSWTAATDGSDSSGVKEYQYKLDSGSWIATPQTTVQLISLSDGPHTFYLKVLDNAVNIGTEQSCTFKIDTTAPTTPTPSSTTTDWVSSSSMTVSWTAATDGSDSSGVKEYQYKLDSGLWIATPQTTVELISLSDGPHTFYLKVLDNVSNEGSEQTCSFKIDTTAPTTPTPSPTTTDWVSYSSMTISWSDGIDVSSGVKEYQYKLDSGSWIATTETSVLLNLLIDGSHLFSLKVLDNVNNEGIEQTTEFKIDKTPPVESLLKINSGSKYSTVKKVSLSLSANDAHSGLSMVRIRNNDNPWSEWMECSEGIQWDLPSDIGKGDVVEIWVMVKDLAGNEGGAVSSTITYDPDRKDETKPILSDRSPGKNAKIIERRPKISCKILDSESGLDSETLVFKLNNEVKQGTFKEGIFDYQVVMDLPLGIQTIVIEISDNNGNKLTETWTFEIINDSDDITPGDDDDDITPGDDDDDITPRDDDDDTTKKDNNIAILILISVGIIGIILIILVIILLAVLIGKGKKPSN